RSVEIVVDGGAALYGFDAVAGVANLIPYKRYDGFKGRVYYKTDKKNSSEQYTAEILMGHRFDIGSGLEWVGAVEINRRTPVLVSGHFWSHEFYDQDSVYDIPGGWVSGLATGRTGAPCCTFIGVQSVIIQFGSYPSVEAHA